MILTEFQNKAREGMRTEEVLDLYWYALDENCPLAMVNENGRITYINGRFSDQTGYGQFEVHFSISDLLHPGCHHESFKTELTEQIRSGKTWRRKICLKHRNGQAVCFKTAFYPSPGEDPSKQHLLIFLPEQSVPSGPGAPSDSSRERFSTLAHDLRSPLSNITSLCGLLQDTPLDENQRDFVSKMKRSASLLSGKLDDLLLSFIEKQKEDLPVLRTFNLKKTITGFPALFLEKAKERGVAARLETDENLPEEVFGDENQIKYLVGQITHCLFSRPGLRSAKTSLLVEGAKNDACEISFFFLGQYASPPEDMSPPAESAEGEECQMLEKIRSTIAQMGGSILLEEQNPLAYYFHFLLPFSLSSAPEVPIESETEEESAPAFPPDARILVAEDVELNQLVMKHQLQKIGLEADFVRTGFNVLERLRVFPYDLVLMDVQMPGMNGLQTIEAIRSDQTKPWHLVPIIGITASIGGNAREQCLSAGADDFVPKPYNLDDLSHKVKILIADYRQRKPLSIENPPNETNMKDKDKYFDLSYLEEISEGDRDFSSTMISYFIDNTPSVMENLEKKVGEHDWDEVRQIAHKLKPQVVYMGIHQVEEDIEQVEHLAQHREKLEQIPALVQKTSEILNLAIEQLKEELKKFS